MRESQALAEHTAQIRYEDLDDAVVHVSKNSVLDTIGVMLAAGTLGEGCKEFVNMALSEGGKKQSTIVGFGVKAPLSMAVFANGSMTHALDFEDSHDEALVHPSATTVPVALALAESLGNVSGRELIAAVAVGNDVSCRLGLALNEDLLQYGWYTPPVLAAFGGAAAASKLIALNPGQILDAFSLALCQATGSAELAYNPDSVIRGIRDAFSAKAGLISALLAKRGITGFKEPFEGKAGFFNMYAKGNYDRLKLTNGLGKTFEGARVSFKPWPSCRFTHSYIDGLLELLKTHHVNAADVEEIKVVVGPVNKVLCEPSDRKRHPVTAIDAKFSIPFVVATALTHGKVNLDHFTAQAFENKDVLAAAHKVTYELNDRLTRKDATKGFVQMKTRDGVFSKAVEFPYGHPEHPISDEMLVAKFMDCATHTAKRISEKDLHRVTDLILHLEDVKDIREITKCL
ncbi:MAG TPA: MmgE/PrpD family protein [Syntrophorhabdaceae bacterium]|nr:MmgE/PrpD family protein [Syntrophorhabdaceae bacterium]